MNLHEFQGKQILENYGANIQKGILAHNNKEALEAAKKIKQETGKSFFVVKAQVHAGGRGKGGGIKLAKSFEEVDDFASSIIGMNLVTPQTSKEGKKVNKVLVCEDVYDPGEFEIREFYFSILLDRKTSKNVIVYSTEGGMDIEEVAEKTPELIFKEIINPGTGVLPFQARKIAFNLGLKGTAFKEMLKFVNSAYNAYLGSDSSLVEINPLIQNSSNNILAVDCKFVIDDNSIYRNNEIGLMRDKSEENKDELEAAEFGLNYVKLDGNVGCVVNGAGLAMATMDLIKQAGGNPANFLDVGGTADANRVEQAFRIILKDKNVKCILVNIFGGIVRCDRVAKGIVDAYNKIGEINIPIIVRLQGTNAEIAKDIIESSGLKVHSVTLFKDAALKVQELLS